MRSEEPLQLKQKQHLVFLKKTGADDLKPMWEPQNAFKCLTDEGSEISNLMKRVSSLRTWLSMYLYECVLKNC